MTVQDFSEAMLATLNKAEGRYGKEDTVKALQEVLGRDVKHFYGGNVIKYVSRALKSRSKEKVRQDLIKAATYLYFIWKGHQE